MIDRDTGTSKPDKDDSNWLTTYSDMVTLLMAFFVLMLSFSTVDAAEFERTMMSLQEALGLLKGGRTVAVESGKTELPQNRDDLQRRAAQVQQMLHIRRQMGAELTDRELHEGTEYRLTERGLIVQFTDQVLFPSGSADLRPGAKAVLDALAPILRELPNDIRVEGHTDNVPISTAPFPSNWELSAARATNVLRYLLQMGELESDRLSAAGYGEYRPIASNDSAEGRAQNRRVDVVLLRLDAGRYEPQ